MKPKNNLLSKSQLMAAAAGMVVTLGLGASAITFAQTATATPGTTPGASRGMHMPGVGGTVTAVSGNTVTVTGMDGKTYTIDASAAAITKEQTVSVSSIAVGDTVMAAGSVNGTTVTATSIHDGKMMMGMGHGFGGKGGRGGHGIHGTVSSISGNTLTVTATNPKDSTTATYTVDATNATVLKGDGTSKPVSSTLSSVAIGDNVLVDGTISGTSVTAKMIIDGPVPKMGQQPPAQTNTTTTTQ